MFSIYTGCYDSIVLSGVFPQLNTEYHAIAWRKNSFEIPCGLEICNYMYVGTFLNVRILLEKLNLFKAETHR